MPKIWDENPKKTFLSTHPFSKTGCEERIWKMIEISILNETVHFENYGELFDCLTMIENLKTMGKRHNFTNWSFTVFPAKPVAALHTHNKFPFAAVGEAFEEHLPLIEICTGDYKDPSYVVVTPNVDTQYFQQKWCLDYCRFHHLTVKENAAKEACLSNIGKEIII